MSKEVNNEKNVIVSFGLNITGDWKYNEYGHWQPIICNLNTCHIEETPLLEHVDDNNDGDVLLQKTYIADFFTGKQVPNRGQCESYLLESHHEAIIPRKSV